MTIEAAAAIFAWLNRTDRPRIHNHHIDIDGKITRRWWVERDDARDYDSIEAAVLAEIGGLSDDYERDSSAHRRALEALRG